MKPRQTIKNYHNSSAPPYQHLQNTSATTPPTLRDIDLVKLGLNLDDIPNLQQQQQASNNPNSLTSQEEIVKCLQAIYSKSQQQQQHQQNVASSKLPTLNDWPMQSVSPPDHYSRAFTGGGGGSSSSGGANFNNNSSGNNNNNNNISSSSGSSGGGINNPGHQQKQQQDIHFSNSQQQHSHSQPPPPSSLNHHFRISNSNLHSQPQQQKSVLSLHHHQNDLSSSNSSSSSSGRRLNQQHHNHMSTTNSSLANLSSVQNATSTSNSSSLDTNSLNTLSGKISNVSGSGGGGVSIQVPNIIDTFGSMDNMFYDNAMLGINKEQQSLVKHQHLQKLLKATGSQHKSSLSSPSTLSHRNESQPQRNITSNHNMPPTQLPIPNPASAISPPQAAFSSVPKSLLNLAACSSSSPSTNTSSLPSASKFSSMVSQLNLMSARNQANTSSQANLNNNSNSNANSNIRSFARNNNSNNNNNDSFNQKGTLNGIDQSNLLQHMIRPNTTNNGPPTTRSGSKQVQLSLLSEDQSSIHRSSSKPLCNVNSNPNLKPPSGISRQSGVSPKDAYLANLQERAARVGVSIGEISKTTPSNQQTNQQVSNATHNNNAPSSNPIAQLNTVSISPNQTKDEYMNTVDRKEIESALSRVEARNDLSLLYPPMLLASNSQKQINALSAGLEGTEDSELFTKEVKKIVLEECNIIYECKECNNLFRSLANLVKHKRNYCVQENSSGRNSIDMNKRSYVNSILPMDQSITINSASVGETNHDLEVDQERNSALVVENRPIANESSLLASNQSYNARNLDRRNNLSHMIRIIQNQEKKNQQQQQQRDITRLKGQNNGSASGGTPAPQTSLSKLLQSQPKTRLPVSRDSALIGALNMAPISLNENPLSAFESDKNINISSNDMDEQFVRNSSLAKTLLNEKVRATSNTKQSSLSELSKMESTQLRATTNTTNTTTTTATTTTKRAAPKRKFLEDCIQKVKRDKLLTEEEYEEGQVVHMAPTTSNSNAALIEATNLQQVNKEIQLTDQEPGIVSDISKFNSPGDSGDESDMLTIDLESPSKKTLIKKEKRRISTIASSSTSSNKLNTSSALLKALTRPVDTKQKASNTSTAVPGGDDKLSPTDEESEELVASSPNPSKEFNEKLSHDQKELEANSPTHPQQDTSSSKYELIKISSDSKEPEEKMSVDELSPDDPRRPLFDIYTCEYCNLDMEDPAEMMKHSLQMHSKMMIIFPCHFCSFSFISIENVCRHILEIHKKPKSEIQRHKDLVQSRSFESADFSSCRDCPQITAQPEQSKQPKLKQSPTPDVEMPSEMADLEDEEEAGEGLPVDNHSSTSSSPTSSNSSSSSSRSNFPPITSSDSSSSSASSNNEVSPSSSQYRKSEASTAKQPSVSEAASPNTESKVLEDSQSSSSSDDDDDDDDDDADEEDDEDGEDGDEDDEFGNLSPQEEDNVESAAIATEHRSSSNDCDGSSNEQDDEFSAGNEGNDDEDDDDDDSTSPQHASEEQKQLAIEQVKLQNASHKPSPSSRSNPEPSTSSIGSVGSASGGIMKLKIQLKTRPDEKSKVYEIV